MKAEKFFKEGNEFFDKGDYSKGFDCYEKWLETGNYTFEEDVLETILSNSEKALQVNPRDARAWQFKGIALSVSGNDQEAIKYYDKAIELKSDYANAYNNKGNALFNLGKYQEAIECYDKAIELKSDYANAYNNKGNALFNLGKYQEAIEYYDKAIELDPNHANAYNNKGNVLFNLGKYQEAAECFNKAKTDVYEVFIISEETARYMLDDDKFFQDATRNIDITEKEREKYKDIYLCSLKILKELQVKKNDNEKYVAHYTKKDISEKLLFDKNRFRLTSVSTANDTQEGKTLFDYLFDNRKMRPQAEEFGAFVGCFMFNHDNLNQFRLYGKENNIEGTGISIVMKPDFFSVSDKMPLKQTKSIEKSSPSKEDEKDPLFRCIYIDPETSQIVSVGHRDFHTFYKTKEILYGNADKEYIDKIKEEIEKYKKDIDKIKENVVKDLTNLKDIIEKKQLEPNVIYNLLLNLRYLVKHVAFKEEQECRIIKIERLCKANTIKDEDNKHERLYIDYLPLQNCVKKIYFGPKAAGMELFQNLLIYNDFKNVACYRSTSPLA
jgi:tetratricopeptide (TPR) repeat protein